MSKGFVFDGKEYTRYYPEDERKATKNECICAATGVLFFIPLISIPDSQYGKYWANQGLITLAVEFLCLIVGLLLRLILGLLAKIPYIGLLFKIIHVICLIGLWGIVVMFIAYGIYYTAKCRAKNLPYIGTIRFFK